MMMMIIMMIIIIIMIKAAANSKPDIKALFGIYTVKTIHRFYGKIPGIGLPVLLPLYLQVSTCRTFLEMEIW